MEPWGFSIFFLSSKRSKRCHSGNRMKSDELLPWNLTWNLKMEVWKMIFLFSWVLFRFHVKFQGSTFFLPCHFPSVPLLLFFCPVHNIYTYIYIFIYIPPIIRKASCNKKVVPTSIHSKKLILRNIPWSWHIHGQKTRTRCLKGW